MIDEILKKFTKQELRDFRYFISRRNNHVHERKDLKYISDVRNNILPGATGNKEIHQIKKRLKKQIEQFVQLENIRFDITSVSFNYIETATYLFRKQMPEYAWQYLLKAEKNALSNEDYGVLAVIYYVQIAYASNIYGFELPISGISNIIEKLNANQVLSNLDASANAAYAEIKYKIRSLNYPVNSKTDIQDIINSTLQNYQLTDTLYDHPRVYGKIVNIVCRGLAEIGAYVEMGRYALKAYLLIKNRRMIEAMHPDYLNELLLAICQSQLSINNYVRSYCFLGMYKKSSEVFKYRDDKYNYHQFMQSLIDARIMICMGQLDEAEHIIFQTLQRHEKQRTLISGFDAIYFELFTVYFCQQDWERCVRIYNKMNRETDWIDATLHSNNGPDKFIFDIYAVICYYLLNDDEYALELLKKIKRNHKDRLKKEHQAYYTHFMSIMENLLKDRYYIEKSKFQADVAHFMINDKGRSNYYEYIDLNLWLNSIRTGKNYYDCFLQVCSSKEGEQMPL